MNSKRVKKLVQNWRQTTVANRMLAGSTVLLTLATTGLVIVSVLQYLTIKEQTSAIKNQLVTMRDQTKTMQGQLETFNDQANSMREQSETLKDSLDETRKAVKASQTQADASLIQARTSQVSARAAEKSARIAAQSLSIGERAYIGVKHVELSKLIAGQSPSITVTLFNGGRAPATHFSFTRWIYVISGKVDANDDLTPFIRQELREPISSDFLPAGAEKIVVFRALWRLSEKQLSGIDSNSLQLYFRAWVYYEDSMGKQRLALCGTYNPEHGDLDQCQDW